MKERFLSSFIGSVKFATQSIDSALLALVVELREVSVLAGARAPNQVIMYQRGVKLVRSILFTEARSHHTRCFEGPTAMFVVISDRVADEVSVRTRTNLLLCRSFEAVLRLRKGIACICANRTFE